MKSRIIVFSKDPKPGNVKTRLARSLGAAEAASFYRAMVLDLLDKLMHFREIADIEIHLDTHSDFFETLDLPLRLQLGQQLGDKLYHSIQTALAEGAPQVVILGSDSPELSVSDVQSLLDLSANVAFGPAHDGGFWGVMAHTADPSMFQGVPWSSSDTLRACMERATAAGLTVALGPRCGDIDELEDLLHLDRKRVGGRTRDALDALSCRIAEAIAGRAAETPSSGETSG